MKIQKLKEQKKQTLTGGGHKCMWLRSILHQLHQNTYEKARNTNVFGNIDWNMN